MTGRPGFTLVELLVVIAIIAVLIAILLPTINMVQNMLIKTECARNLHSAHQIVMAYASESGGQLPALGGSPESVSETTQPYPGGTPRRRHLMAEKLQELGASAKDFACPAHPHYKDIGESAYYSWRVPEGMKLSSWSKSFAVLGYAFFQYSAHFTRHPSGGHVIPNRWDTWSRFLDGRFLPVRNDEQGNPPLACDVMKIKSVYEGFWHDPLRESLSGDEDDSRCVYPGGGGHTLFLAGDVVWFDWGELEGQGPYYEANNDIYYYFGREKPSD